MLQTSKPKYSGVSASLTWTTLVPSGDQGRGVATIGHKWGNFGLCCCGWQTVGSAPDEKSFYGVANRPDGCIIVPFSRSKRKFRIRRMSALSTTKDRFSFLIRSHVPLRPEHWLSFWKVKCSQAKARLRPLSTTKD